MREDGWRLGVDIGGTFTDFQLMNTRSGEVVALKTPSTPEDPSLAVARGLEEITGRHGIDPADIRYFAHGTTLAVNTLLERKGACTGVLMTRGFTDTLELRRLRLSKANDFFVPRPVPLVPRRLVRPVDERLKADGEVVRSLRREDVEEQVRALLAEGVETIAVCLLHAYRNPHHERLARQWIRESFPETYVTVSTDVWPQQREYERALISVINAYVGSRMEAYFTTLEKRTRDLAMPCRVFSTKSNGGVMTAASAARRPVETLLSGPASGVIGARHVASSIGDDHVVTLDMGGTSVDVSIIQGAIGQATDNTIGDIPVIMPAVDVSAVGAGGGSIAWTDNEGVLKVGPRSAGALPGPACYGRGGTEPTVTDAYLVAGIIAEDSLLDGTMVLDHERAHAAIDQLAAVIGRTRSETADAILQVTTANIYAQLLPLTARRGIDTTGFSMLAYGAAGPTQAFMLARELDLRRIIVPPAPGTLCALGCLVADFRADFVQSVWRDLDALSDGDLGDTYALLENEARAWLAEQDAGVADVHVLRSADLCHIGQSYEINVPFPDVPALSTDDLNQWFLERYQKVYGYHDPHAPVRMLEARLQIVGVTPSPPALSRPAGGGAGPRGVRRVHEAGTVVEAHVWRRQDLRQGKNYPGPLVIEQYDTTTWVPPGFVLMVDEYGNLIGGTQLMDDPVRLEILLNRFQAIVDEMAGVISRTAHTVFVKETQDYGSVLVSRSGEVFAAPRRYGVLMMIGMPMAGALERIGDDVGEGDVFISNDPDATRGMATHLSDVYLWAPIHVDGELLCWAWTFIHVSDIGGRVPGSIAPSSHEIIQEGLRIPPQKLYCGGVLNQPLLDMILANCRTPEGNWGDMKACLAGLATAERRVRHLVDHYGRDVIDHTIDEALDYAETQARRVIAHVPDGSYRYTDYIEADMVGLGLVRIHVTLTVEGDGMLLDFTGTAPQVRAALNIPTYNQDGHWMLITGLVNWMCTQAPAIAYNAGLVRPLRVKIPKGTILNPEPGAACGARYSTSHKVCDVTVGALAQAVPMELPATDSGQGSILLVSVPDLETGGTRVSVIQPIVGGSGGRPVADGVDGTMVILNFLKNIPTEIFENEMPEILIRHYGLREDSGGPGRYRGGTGIEIEIETSSHYTSITSRCMERYVFGPPGRLGGHMGATGYTTLNPGTSLERDLGKIDVLELGPGDVLRIGTQGGGGFGDPLERPEADVAADVANGVVHRTGAERHYGVVLDDDGAIDAAATAERRQAIRAERSWQDPPLYGFGEAREAWSALWPDDLEDAISAATDDLPVQLRQFVHQQLVEEIRQRLKDGETVAPACVPDLLATLR